MPVPLEVNVSRNGSRVEFALGEYAFWVEANVPLSAHAFAALPAATPIAMRQRRTIVLPEADEVALDSHPHAQSLFASWYRHFRPVEVTAASISRATSQAPGVGAFFSGGVDSFHSALKNRESLTHLIFVRGFDIGVDDDDLGERAAVAARSAAADLGLELIEVRTSIRVMSERVNDWGREYHGTALATIALLLDQHLGRVLVPSSYPGNNMHPWGSHPDLDRHWSSSAVDIVHDGTEGRAEKTAYIAKHALAMKHLRVCLTNPDGAYNCGECEKCIRTMIALQSYGALEACQTLPSSISPNAVRRLHLSKAVRTVTAEENLALLLNDVRADPQVAKALRHAMRVSRVRNAAGAAKRAIKVAAGGRS